MHKKISFIFAVFFINGCIMSQEVKEKWASERIFKVPESVLYYPQENVLFVSNINGKAGEKDGNGFISKLSVEGKLIKLEWVKGLNAPKGMAIYQNKLFVSDIDVVVEIDLKSGVIKNRYKSAEAMFLNDVAVSKTGSIYVSDMSVSHSAIYCLKDGNFTVWASGKEISSPNGLFAEEDKLIFGNSGDGKIKSINYQTKEIRTIAATGDIIDGLRADGIGNYIISDWKGKVSLADKEGNLRTLLNTTNQKVNAADLEYIINSQLLVIPTFSDNRVVAYKLIY